MLQKKQNVAEELFQQQANYLKLFTILAIMPLL